MKVVLGMVVWVRGPVGEAHSSSHYGRWLLWYFRLSISGGGWEGGGRWGEIPRGGLGLLPSFLHLSPHLRSHPLLPLGRPCPASPLTAHLLTAITPPSSSPPSHCLPLYLPPLLHLPSLSHTLAILPPHSQHSPHSLPFYISPGRQPLTLRCPSHAKNYY